MFECLKNEMYRDYIFRKEIETFTGGVLTEYTFESPSFKNMPDRPQSTKIGGRVVYKIDDIISWRERHVIVEKNTEI